MTPHDPDGAVGALPKPGTIAFAHDVRLAALKEVGIDTTGADLLQGVELKLDQDPRLHWRAVNIARKSIGFDEWPWEEWCQWHRGAGPQSTAWLDHWGAP